MSLTKKEVQILAGPAWSDCNRSSRFFRDPKLLLPQKLTMSSVQFMKGQPSSKELYNMLFINGKPFQVCHHVIANHTKAAYYASQVWG